MADGSREAKYFLKIEEDKNWEEDRVWLPRSRLDSRVDERRPETTTQSCLAITSIFRSSIWLLFSLSVSQLTRWNSSRINTERLFVFWSVQSARLLLSSPLWVRVGVYFLHLFGPASVVDLFFLFSVSNVTVLSRAVDRSSHSIGYSDTSEYCNPLHVIYANITVCKVVIRKFKEEKWWQ